MAKTHSRRKFVAGMTAFAAGALLAACGDPTATSLPNPAPTTAKPAATTASAATTTTEKKAPHWTYEGAEGPEEWGKLDPAFTVCSTGKTQSPIDLPASTTTSPLKKLERNYSTSNVNILNNGHTVQVNYDKGSTLTIDGKQYSLAQFHFHTPSEHKFAGQSFPLEVHFVHQADDKSLAVIGIMLAEGAENPFLAKFWDKMPTTEDKQTYNISINANDTFPSDKGYYTYTGSLTTPDCAENVRWIVMKKPVTVSKAQIDKFAAIVHGNNARPVQPLNGREVGVGEA
jgi:carbonic anhydrase